MWRGANSLKDNYLLLVFIKNTIKNLCLFLEIKCAIEICAFDFFYSLKQRHCRSPPPINSQKRIDWRKENAI